MIAHALWWQGRLIDEGMGQEVRSAAAVIGAAVTPVGAVEAAPERFFRSARYWCRPGSLLCLLIRTPSVERIPTRKLSIFAHTQAPKPHLKARLSLLLRTRSIRAYPSQLSRTPGPWRLLTVECRRLALNMLDSSRCAEFGQLGWTAVVIVVTCHCQHH